jgi:antitoxin Phd
MTDVLRFRNARGELVELEAVSASELKNEPATIIDRVAAGRPVAIKRHNSTRAVILSFDDFQRLALAREPSLDALAAQFDELLESMQGSRARNAVAAAFESTPEELGRSAREVAKTKRRSPRAIAAKRVTTRRAGGAR